MKNMKFWRTALVATLVLTVMLSVTGGTIAWFTDEVTSEENIVKSGTLDVALSWKNPTETDYKDASAGAIFNYQLWEPGYTDVKYIKVENLGDLAFKYQLNIKPSVQVAEGATNLADAIEVYFGYQTAPATTGELHAFTPAGTLSELIKDVDGAAYGVLLPAGKTPANDFEVPGSVEMWIALHMKEEAGNEYQNLSVGEGFALQLLATQYTYEADSFGIEYDAKASYDVDNWNGEADADWGTGETAPVENVYTINTAEELAAFAAKVNGGENYAGKTIKLANNIDLNNMAWAPIGTKTNRFEGMFDGQGYTVSNFKVDVDKYAGLFGNVRHAVIKNVNVKNAIIEASDYAGGVVGWTYGSVENCHVENINVTVTPYWDESLKKYDGGAKAGGVIGATGEGSYNFKGNSAKNVTITGYRDLGGVVGMLQYSNIFTGNTAEAVEINYILMDNAEYNGGNVNENAGLLYGRENVPDGKPEIDFGGNKPTNNGITPNELITTASGLQAVLNRGGVFTLTEDLEIDADDTVQIKKDVTATLDLNGKTLSSKSDATGANRNMFDVNGAGAILTVKNGTITTEHTGTNMGWGNSTNVFNVTAGGVLNIENATIKNLGGSDMGFGVHLNNWGEVTLNVENSTIESNYVAVRVFNSGNDKNNVTIKNSKLHGDSNAFWVHNYTAADFGNNQAKADVQAALLNFNDLYNSGNTLTAGVDGSAVKVVRYGFTNSIRYDANGHVVE